MKPLISNIIVNTVFSIFSSSWCFFSPVHTYDGHEVFEMARFAKTGNNVRFTTVRFITIDTITIINNVYFSS